MDWLHHPRFSRQRLQAIERLKHDEYDFLRIKKVVFLCGGYQSPRRDALSQYLERNTDDTLVFYAEAVWAVIATGVPTTNALAVEEKLAQLADIVIIFVESPGTFAEIGAFALSDPLRAKLLPILDQSFKANESFLTSGPVRWIDKDSKFAPPVWTDFDKVLVAADAIENRLARIPRGRPASMNATDLMNSPKHLLFFVCDLIGVFGPCPIEHVSDTMVELLGPAAVHVDVSLYLALGKAMRLLESFAFDGREYFFRRLDEGRLPAFQRKRHIDLPTLRSQVLSAMQGCGPCIPVLAELARYG
jgi:hypothetical protein